MKHFAVTSKMCPALAATSWWQEALDKIACLINPELEKCAEVHV